MKVTKELYQAFYGLENPGKEFPSEFNVCKLFYKWRDLNQYPVDFPGMEFLCDTNPEEEDNLFMVYVPDNMFGMGIPNYVDEDELLDNWYYEFQDFLEKEIPKFGFILEKKNSVALWFKEVLPS